MSHDNLIPNYSYSVLFDGIKVGFSKVSNISGSAEIETIVNGGRNNEPIILRKPKRNPDMLVFERGMRTSLSDTVLSFFKEGHKVDNITINVLRNGKTVRMFFVNGGIIVRREYSPLDALGSGVFLQALQIAHNGISEVALPFSL